MPKKSSSVESGSAEGSVKEEEGVVKKSSLPVQEDVRKLEDTVEIINRRQTAEVDNKVRRPLAVSLYHTHMYMYIIVLSGLSKITAKTVYFQKEKMQMVRFSEF